MQNKLLAFLREYRMTEPGDTVICAVSGGTDSVALLFALYLLKDKLGIHLEAVHFNHHLRGAESDRDEDFVRELCDRYDIPLHVGSGRVVPGKKGLEAAAREARYAYFSTLSGKIATAHTADDNAETVLLHLIRGTGLKGLGGIAPIRGNLIRPMLRVTRQENERFLETWNLPHMEDSTNASDKFLRNRIRHSVMPLLARENPRIGENLSQMALGLREDESYIAGQAQYETLPPVEKLKTLSPAIRRRMLARFLQDSGVREPEDIHISQAERLLWSPKPSAKVRFPGGVAIGRNYDRLEVLSKDPPPEDIPVNCPGETDYGDYRIVCTAADALQNTADIFTVHPQGTMTVGPRREGDAIRLPGGTKTLKKLYIDRKIPAAQRPFLPVIRDETGILGVAAIAANLDREAKTLPAVTVRIIKKEGNIE